jgi:hypothetical protein
VPTTLPSSRISYTPATGFLGDDGFDFRATSGATVDTGRITVHVRLGECSKDPSFCDDGRP